MKGINFGRVVLGGLLAGIVFNISEYLLNEKVMKSEMEAAMKALGKSGELTSSALTVWIIFGFVMGFLAVWLYAAVRPRFGAGAGTAARTGMFFWVMAGLLPSVAMWNVGLFPISWLALGWTLVEAMIATVAGAWLYKEDGAAA
ncbi:MAG: hypothetical protein ACRD1B_06965 [Thermoanaerobaculia bacterium]